jgi:COP9 signalosome complex subunit 7
LKTKSLGTAQPNLPELEPAQTYKLRQLTLLTLASPFSASSGHADSLTYNSLLNSLDLSQASELESLVTNSIYSGLLTARLSPTSNPPTVQITSVAPLRDLRPQSLPALLHILQTWESRCTSVASDLEAQIANIRATAQQRSQQERQHQDLVDNLVLSNDKQTDNGVPAGGRAARSGGQKLGSKRDLDEHIEGEEGEYDEEYEGMDLDEGIGEGGGLPLSGMRGGGGGSSRGAKRNRGRGSK